VQKIEKKFLRVRHQHVVRYLFLKNFTDNSHSLMRENIRHYINAINAIERTIILKTSFKYTTSCKKFKRYQVKTFQRAKMRVTVIIFMAMSIILLSHLVNSAPTPRPMFPFTTLPKKGEGHRKIAGLKRKGEG
jgi:hypothetical protein